ncbi:hypothetical protein HDU76_008188, partial [Blyttiomyces sp. JEL0837]
MFFCKKSTSVTPQPANEPATATNTNMVKVETTEYKLQPIPFMYFPYIQPVPSYSDCPPVWLNEVKIDAAAFNEKVKAINAVIGRLYLPEILYFIIAMGFAIWGHVTYLDILKQMRQMCLEWSLQDSDVGVSYSIDLKEKHRSGPIFVVTRSKSASSEFGLQQDKMED